MAVPDSTIPLIQGDSFSLPLYFSDDNGPIDISGWTIKCQLRKTISQPTADLTCQFEIKNQSTQKGWGRIFASSAQTLALPMNQNLRDQKFTPTQFAFDIVTVNTSGDETQWGKGVWVVTPLVSRG